MRPSLGLLGDLDDVELVQDVEEAFGVRLTDKDLMCCKTVGDLFDLLVTRLPNGTGKADRCASAMCFYRLRRAVLAIAPQVQLRPSTPITALQDISVRTLHRAIREAGLRPPLSYVSGRGVGSLLTAVIAPLGLLWADAPWWAALISFLAAIVLYRLSPLRLPSELQSFGDLTELITARSIGMLATSGARLQPTEAWKALKAICGDHVVPDDGEIHEGTLIYQPR